MRQTPVVPEVADYSLINEDADFAIACAVEAIRAVAPQYLKALIASAIENARIGPTIEPEAWAAPGAMLIHMQNLQTFRRLLELQDAVIALDNMRLTASATYIVIP
jgi:hypothetical protein